MSESDSGGPGVHGMLNENVLEGVRDALDERLCQNYGSTVYIRAGTLWRDHDVLDGFRAQQVTAALLDLANGDQEERFVVERTNPDANRARWKVQRTDREHDPEREIRADGGQFIPPLASKPISFEWSDNETLEKVVFQTSEGERWWIEGEMRVVDPHGDQEDVATDGGKAIPDHYIVECRFCEGPTVAFEQKCRSCGANRHAHREEFRADGGKMVEEPTSQRAVRIVLDDARPGGLSRTVLVERAAEIARTTQADAEDALEDLRKCGEVYDVDGEYQLTPEREFELDWDGEFS